MLKILFSTFLKLSTFDSHLLGIIKISVRTYIKFTAKYCNQHEENTYYMFYFQTFFKSNKIDITKYLAKLLTATYIMNECKIFQLFLFLQ